ncbi:unnamed protein product, partial [Soboliphyme baturini]|uniref:Inward rectifier potassium channel irk-1 n=1 Tax=Soboliphyme baturini TaxID=241478 RepID=A0A183IJW0_9BILA
NTNYSSNDGLTSNLIADNIRSLGTIPFAIGSTEFTKRLLGKRIKRSRLVKKTGEVNVTYNNVPKLERQFMRDLFTTLIDVNWGCSLLIFCSLFVFTWVLFALIYYVLSWTHGDFDQSENDGGKPCIRNVYDFASIMLFSVETQHTIGYGKRYITTNCSSTIVVLCIQSICGLLIQSFVAGIVFAKLARPRKRAETITFSKDACISLRNGQLCFLFRIGDMRNTHLVEAHVRLQMIRQAITEEGEVLILHQQELDLGINKGADRLFLVWPTTVCYVIDAKSPLYNYSCESTGMTAQALTSYVPSEIRWGHRFEKLVTFQKQNGDYQIDWSYFHRTYAVRTPLCSAKELSEYKVSNSHPDHGDYHLSALVCCTFEPECSVCTETVIFGGLLTLK